MDIYYVDGEFLPASKAFLPVDDLAIMRGYGVFDFLRTYNRKPFFLTAHLDRLLNSAKIIRLEIPWPIETLEKIVCETLGRNNHSESNIRIVITGGPSEDYITPMGQPRLIVMVTQLTHPPVNWYTDGVKVITQEVNRYTPGAKSIKYVTAVIALHEARLQNAIEAIYFDQTKKVFEGTTTNIFCFVNNKLITPGTNILPGISRQVVLDIAKDEFEIEIQDLDLAQLYSAQEVFIAATNKEIVPVIQVDNHLIQNGRPGPRTQKIRTLFNNYTQSNSKK